MHITTTTRKKAQGIPVAVLVVIVILVCMSFFPPAGAMSRSVPVTIWANYTVVKQAAQFEGTPLDGLAPLTVQFTDLTPGNPISWLWSFGDGTTSSERNPKHTYSKSGLYTVSLSVTYAPGGVPTKTEISNYIGSWASSYNLIFNTPGLTGTTDITFDPTAFIQAGGTYTLDGNVLTLNYPAGSSFKQLVITFSSPPTQSNGIITGHVFSATLETKDLAGSLIQGVEQHSIIFYLTAVPPQGSGVQTDTIQSADPLSMAEFERIASLNGLDLVGAYYEMFVSTTIPQSTITSMGIKMAVPSGWYNPYSNNDIRIIGIDPQGNAGIIPTGAPLNSGGFVIFNAPSFTGYDTFGMAIVRQRYTAYDSGWSEPPGSVIGPEQQVAPNVENPQAQIEQLAPSAEIGDVASSTADFSLDGDISTDTGDDGRMNLTINRSAVEKSGATIVVENNTVTIDHPLFSIFISCMKITEREGWIYGEDVLIILPTTKPLQGTISGQQVSAWLNTQLYEIQHGSMITTTLSEPINEEHNKGFENALKNEGLDIQAVDYTMKVTKTNITATHSANITMTASPEWVEANGGIDSIYIVRLGDDGTQQVLKTRFIGYDETGNMIFEAESPDGLSIFGLVSAKATEEKLAEDKNATIVAVSKPAMSVNVGMIEWGLTTVQQNPLVLVIVIAVIAVIAYFGWWRRRL